MSTCHWKAPIGPTTGIVVWSIDAARNHCPRCCGVIRWNGRRGMCATGHILVIDPQLQPAEQLLRDIFEEAAA